MKNIKLKNVSKLGILIFAMFIFFTNCEKDTITLQEKEEAINEIEEAFTPHKPELLITNLDYSKVRDNPNIQDKLTSLLKYKKTSTTSKTITSTNQDFSINTEMVKYLKNQDNTYHSYTFSIERDGNNSVLENLLLSYQTNGTYKAYIIKYNLTEQEILDLKNNLFVDLSKKVSSDELKDDQLISNIFSRQVNIETTIVIETECCTEGNHENGRMPNGSPCPANGSCFTYNSTGGGGLPSGGTSSTGNTSECKLPQNSAI